MKKVSNQPMRARDHGMEEERKEEKVCLWLRGSRLLKVVERGRRGQDAPVRTCRSNCNALWTMDRR